MTNVLDGHYLLTGMPGSGKTTVGNLLEQQGWPVLHADRTPELGFWYERSTGNRMACLDDALPTLADYDWCWDARILTENLADQQPGTVVCGYADNLPTFLPRFRQVIVLVLGIEDAIERMQQPRDHGFGTLPAHRDYVESRNVRLAVTALYSGNVTTYSSYNSPEVIAEDLHALLMQDCTST